MFENHRHTASATTPAQRAVVAHLKLLTSGSIDEWSTLFSPDATFAFPFGPPDMVRELHGLDAMTTHMRNLNVALDVQATDIRFIDTVDPLVTVAEWVLEGTVPATGKPFHQPCVGIVTLDAAGLIIRYEDLWNPLVSIEAFTPAGQ